MVPISCKIINKKIDYRPIFKTVSYEYLKYFLLAYSLLFFINSNVKYSISVARRFPIYMMKVL